jgi:hypothetical protein
VVNAEPTPPHGDQPLRQGVWIFELAFVTAILVESLLPLRVFHLRMDPADVVILGCIVVSGFAVIRSTHALLWAWLLRRGGVWLARLPGVLGVAAIAAGGMWHGPQHYSLWSALVLGISFVAGLSWFAGPDRSLPRRIAGGVVSAALFVFVVLLVDLNLLSLFPRHVSALGNIVAGAWLAGTLAIAPPLPPRMARTTLSMGGLVAALCLVLAPLTSSRAAGYLRRQSELGALMAPVAWTHDLSPSTYLTWSNDSCPAVPPAPVMIAGQPNDFNVLLISIDTLRRDLYLRPGEAMDAAYPNLASVARDGCHYQNVRSVGAATHLVMPALYNGTLAWTSLERPLLAALADRGHLRARSFGGLRQIADYTGVPGGGGDLMNEPITTRMIAELAQATTEGRPWMMIAHYLDLHLPRKAELLSQFSGDLRPVYARKLAGVDAELGRLFAAIKARGEWDRTAVVITADHGEELNERGYSEHAFHLYETVLDVPLIVRLPGQRCLDPQTPATLLDVIPMLAGAMGLEAQSPALQGHWPPAQNGPFHAFSTVGGPFIAIIDGTQKIIVDARYDDTEIYDLANDPHERRDLGGELTPAIAARLAQIPIPWNPLVPLAQRYQYANGGEYDVCPGKVVAYPQRQATVQRPALSPAQAAHALHLN